MRLSVLPVAAALALAAAGTASFARPAVSAPAVTAVAAATQPLSIQTAHGRRHFRVEIARTPDEQERGLMFREQLAPDGGMIFPLGRPRAASFWMKNTVIPLDIVFIRANGTVARIAANATPYSLDTIDSGEPVASVLEIAGGRAAALGIAAGDRVHWRG